LPPRDGRNTSNDVWQITFETQCLYLLSAICYLQFVLRVAL